MEKQALGLLLNNPLNIRKSRDKWQGAIKDDEHPFVHFVDRLHGYRAAFIILLNYSKRGADTIFEIVRNWAPASDGNNTKAYMQFVTTATGYPLFTKINFFDKKTMVNIVWAMTQMEVGISEDKDLIGQAYDLVSNQNV